MHSIFHIFITLFLTHFFSITSAIIYSDRHDYDAYGTLLASTDYFVVFAQNDNYRYAISMAPFGMQYMCSYGYRTPNNFVINIAVNRRQNSSQLSFVYLQTNSIDGQIQQLGLFTFSRRNNSGSSSCNQMLNSNEGEHQVKVWNRSASELSTLQVDLDGKYAYGFLSNDIFIYDIEHSSVKDLLWNETFPSINLAPHALDIGKTSDGISMAILAGYYQIDIGRTLPAVYLARLEPPNNIILVDNYTIHSINQKFVRGQFTTGYQFDYVMSVSIHDPTQQVIVAIPQLSQIYCFSFTSTHLTYINASNYPARSTAWLDDSGTQVALLISGLSTLPWAQSQVQVMNVSSNNIMYVYPNNQQTLAQWSNVLPTFLRLTVTYDYQFVILTSDGTVVLVPSADVGYYMITDDITNNENTPQPCPAGTYKNSRGTTPCTVCPARTKSSSTNIAYPTINCTACLVGSFCPLGSIKDVNRSSLQPISQAYAYPPSPSTTSFDDILMQNTFSLTSQPRRCLLISPLFWALMILIIAFVILLIMGLLYYSPTGVKHFHRLECVFRHSDLIGNGEVWFGGLISFSIVVLIVYGFWFGAVFRRTYPIETSTDAYFACDTSLRNAQFSSALQLLATIQSTDAQPMFTMLDDQNFTMTVSFIQTGYTCLNLTTQENVGTYSVTFPIKNCTEQTENAALIVTYQLPHHEMIVQINLTGLYYIGGLLICLTGPRAISNDSLSIVQEMNYCEFFAASDQTLAQTTTFNFGLTKVINQTDSLVDNGSTNYSGIWIPTSTHGSLDDHIIYDQRGPHLRYLSTQNLIIITLYQTNFYINNEQQPIARTGEVISHNILFTTTIIGIFALAFLLFKLTFIALLTQILKRQMHLFKLCRFKKGQILENQTTF